MILYLFFFFHFNLFFLPLSEESTLLCASLFTSCLGTTVICNHNDYVTPPGRMYIHVSQYEVSKKTPFLKKLTVFSFLSFFFFFFGLITRRESEILNHACMPPFLSSKCSFVISCCILELRSCWFLLWTPRQLSTTFF